MSVNKKSITVVACLGLLCLVAWGSNPQVFKENSPVIKKYFGKQEPMGQGSVTKYWFTVYQLALWAKNNRFSYDNYLALRAWQEIEVSQEDLIKETLKKIYDYHHVSPQKLAKYEGYLKKAYPQKIKPKQTWTVVFKPKKSIDFYINDKLYASFKDMEFAEKFFDIWMNPKGEFKDLRKKLLEGEVRTQTA